MWYSEQMFIPLHRVPNGESVHSNTHHGGHTVIPLFYRTYSCMFLRFWHPGNTALSQKQWVGTCAFSWSCGWAMAPNCPFMYDATVVSCEFSQPPTSTFAESDDVVTDGVAIRVSRKGVCVCVCVCVCGTHVLV